MTATLADRAERTERIPVQMLVHGVVLMARAGTLTRDDVNWIGAVARRKLPDGDYLRSAIETFCGRAMPVIRDPSRHPALAEPLWQALQVSIQPVPPGQDRADIHG